MAEVPDSEASRLLSVDYVSGPFEMEKLQLFEGHEEELSFFRSSLRSYLVHHILAGLAPFPFLPGEKSRGSRADGG